MIFARQHKASSPIKAHLYYLRLCGSNQAATTHRTIAFMHVMPLCTAPMTTTIPVRYYYTIISVLHMSCERSYSFCLYTPIWSICPSCQLHLWPVQYSGDSAYCCPTACSLSHLGVNQTLLKYLAKCALFGNGPVPLQIITIIPFWPFSPTVMERTIVSVYGFSVLSSTTTGWKDMMVTLKAHDLCSCVSLLW